MSIHRIVGTAFALTGALVLAAVMSLIFAPLPYADSALDFIGERGIIAGDMAGLGALTFGLWLALRPASPR